MMLLSLATLTFVLPFSFAVVQDEPTLSTPPKPSELPPEIAPVPSAADQATPVEPIAPPKPLIGIRERMALGLLRQFVPAERQRSFDNVVETLQEVAEQVDGVRGVGRTDVRPGGVVQAEARTRKPTRRQRRAIRNGEQLPITSGSISEKTQGIEQTAGQVHLDRSTLPHIVPHSPNGLATPSAQLEAAEERIEFSGVKSDEAREKVPMNSELHDRLENTTRRLYENGKWQEQNEADDRKRHTLPNAALKQLLAERDQLREMLEKARQAEIEARKESSAVTKSGDAGAEHKNPFRGQAGRIEHDDHADHDHSDHEHSHREDDAVEHRDHGQPTAHRRMPSLEMAKRMEQAARARAEAMHRQHVEREHAMRREHEEFEHHVHELERETQVHRLDVARRELHLEQSQLRAETAADPIPVAIWAVERIIDLYGDEAAELLEDLQPKIRHDVIRRYITMRLAEIAEDDREAAIGPLKDLILEAGSHNHD